jgi:hypothetical protein
MRTSPARADQAAGLAGGGWSNPGLGQQVGPQQMGQGLGIHGVVLDPGGRDRLGGQRMGHVGSDAGVGQQIREPAPAVGGLEGDLDRLGLELPEDP